MVSLQPAPVMPVGSQAVPTLSPAFWHVPDAVSVAPTQERPARHGFDFLSHAALALPGGSQKPLKQTRPMLHSVSSAHWLPASGTAVQPPHVKKRSSSHQPLLHCHGVPHPWFSVRSPVFRRARGGR